MTPTAQQVIEAKALLTDLRDEYESDGVDPNRYAAAGFVLLDWIEHLERKLANPICQGDDGQGRNT